MTAPRTQPTAVARTEPAATTPATTANGGDTTASETDSPKSMQRFAQYGALNPAARAEVQRSKQLRGVADMIAITPYGEKLTDAGKVAVARWCIARDIDPLTELDNVGGLYPNSEYYKRKLGELRVRGIVRDVTQEHIANDLRLATLAKDKDAPDDIREQAKADHYRRLQLRIKHGVDEAATGACVTSIFLTAGGDPIVGCKWGGGGTSVKQFKSGGGSAPNPIVENNAVLSVESQSIRRAMMQLAMTHPGMMPGFAQVQEEVRELNAALPEMTAAPFSEPAPIVPKSITVPPRSADAAALRGAPADETGTEEPDFSREEFPESLELNDRRPAASSTDALRNG